MISKFYYVLADTAVAGWQYLGKTSDLAFKVEPDVSVDCDDGLTIVGSEKLSCSMTLLGKVVNPYPIRELWLIPVQGAGFRTLERIKIKVGSDDYKLELKSGDFEKTLLSVNKRYPADVVPPYEIEEWYVGDDAAGDEAVIIGHWNPRIIYDTEIFFGMFMDGNILDSYYIDVADSFVWGTFAIVEGIVSGTDIEIRNAIDEIIATVDKLRSGVTFLDFAGI